MNTNTEPKLTPWFPADVKPVRPGVYQRKAPGIGDECAGYCCWTGSFWGKFSPFISDAVIKSDRPTIYTDDVWRGLAEDHAVNG